MLTWAGIIYSCTAYPCCWPPPPTLPLLRRHPSLKIAGAKEVYNYMFYNHRQPSPPTHHLFSPVENEIEYTLFQISTSKLKMIHFDSPTDLVAKIMKARCLIQYSAAIQLMHNFSDFKYIFRNRL